MAASEYDEFESGYSAETARKQTAETIMRAVQGLILLLILPTNGGHLTRRFDRLER